ncbi:MAG TPA: VOC family protein [Propionibacteriaceae bacterium]|nr:VOC family protein [Propionibacteriaceae bacterium]
MINELNHVGIVVRDLDASLAFYQRAFGAVIVFQRIIPASQTDVVYLQMAGGMIELLHPRNPGPDERYGTTHIAFMSDNLDTDYERLVSQGARELVAPRVAGTGVGRLAFVSDPHGARVELLQRELAMRSTPVEHPHVAAFDHYSVIADDLEAARAFYGDQLGMVTLTTMTVPATGITVDYLHWDYDVLELLHRPTPSSDPIFAHIALRVTDLEALLADLAELGIRPESGTPGTDETGHGRSATVVDPDGVQIELLDRPDLRTL